MYGDTALKGEVTAVVFWCWSDALSPVGVSSALESVGGETRQRRGREGRGRGGDGEMGEGRDM